MTAMSKRERVMAAVRGEPVDRVPVAFFGHDMGGVERQPETLIPHLLARLNRFDWDFLKIQSRPLFYAEAWGLKYRWRWASEASPETEDYPIKSVSDLSKIERLAPTEGTFGEHIKVAKGIGEALSGKVPYVQTVHSPLTSIVRMSGGQAYAPRETERLKQFMKEDPEALHQAVSVVAQTLGDFARASIKAGADGIFVTTGAVTSLDYLTKEEYETFGKPYDLMLFEAAAEEGATFNILHICRENIMFDVVAKYPHVHVLSWEATSRRNPSLKEALSRTDKAVWGGINHRWTLLRGPIEAITSEVRIALKDTEGRRFLLGPGCAISGQVPDAHLVAAKEASDGWQGD